MRVFAPPSGCLPRQPSSSSLRRGTFMPLVHGGMFFSHSFCHCSMAFLHFLAFHLRVIEFHQERPSGSNASPGELFEKAYRLGPSPRMVCRSFRKILNPASPSGSLFASHEIGPLINLEKTSVPCRKLSSRISCISRIFTNFH